jgi:4-amino-4-deoxy-L-arabinose transferase-like glycosyltransferase
MNRTSKIALVAIIVLSGLLRLAFSTFVVGWRADVRGDEVDYHGIAASLAAGDGFEIDGRPTCRRPPGFPFLLGMVYKTTGPHPNAGRVLNILLGVLVVYLVSRVTRLYFGWRPALIAAGIAALNPFLILISSYLLTENLYVVLVLAAFAAVPTPARFAGSVGATVLASVLLGAATLTRPTGLPLGVWMLAAAVLLAKTPWSVRLRNGLVAGVVFVLIVLPWNIRNQHVVGGWVGLTTHGGITFYQGNNQKVVDVPHYRGGVTPLDGLPHADEMAGMGELERDRFAWAKGKEFLRRNRGRVLEIAWWKFARFWRLRSDVGLSGVKSGWWWDKDSFLGRVASNFDAGFLYAIVAFPLFIAGLVLTRARWRDLTFLYGVVVAHTAVALVFFGSIRGRIPVEWVIAVFAAVTVDRLLRRRRPDRP